MPAGTGRFTVDPSALHEMARSMVVLAAYLDGARSATLQTDEATFGDAGLADAAHRFVEHWEWMANKVGEHLLATSKNLAAAAANYQQVEDAQKRSEGIA